MKIDLIYASWPNVPSGIHWHKMADAVRKAGLTARLKKGGFKVKEHVLAAKGEGAGDLKEAFLLSARIGSLVKASHKHGALAVIICGSCTISSLGAIAGLGGDDSGILWMDAHADLNTPETTLSGLFEGMAVSIILGDAWQAMAYEIAGLTAASRRNLCFYGTRDIDAAEQTVIDDEALPVVGDAESAIEALEDCERVYLHLDMDVHDGNALHVSRYSREGGPSPEEVRQHLSELAAALPVAAFSVASLDPDVAEDGAIACAIEHIVALCEARRDAPV